VALRHVPAPGACATRGISPMKRQRSATWPLTPAEGRLASRDSRRAAAPVVSAHDVQRVARSCVIAVRSGPPAGFDLQRVQALRTYEIDCVVHEMIADQGVAADDERDNVAVVADRLDLNHDVD
jgi:hypothetical protein